MKTINLNRVTNTLSDDEMKLVKGGKEPEAVFNPNSDECSYAGFKCSINWSGGTISGTCYYNKNEKRNTCKPDPKK